MHSGIYSFWVPCFGLYAAIVDHRIFNRKRDSQRSEFLSLRDLCKWLHGLFERNNVRKLRALRTIGMFGIMLASMVHNWVSSRQ